MSFIAFVGCDGSGKSAVIRRVAAQLQADGIPVICGHWRPKAFTRESPLGAAAEVMDPHGQPSRGFASSCLKLVWLWLNWWVGWWMGLRNARSKGVVLFDRFHGDLLVDPKRYRYGGPLWLAGIATRLMPQPDLIIFLDAPAEVLLSRKQEVGRSTLELLRRRYLDLAIRHRGFRCVDASAPLDHVVDDVLSQISTQS